MNKIIFICAFVLALISPIFGAALQKNGNVTKDNSVMVDSSFTKILHGQTLFTYDCDDGIVITDTLPYAIVKNMRTGEQVQTDSNGYFSIRADIDDILRVSGMLIKTERIPVTTLSDTTLILKDAKRVLGYMFTDNPKNLKSAEISLFPDSVKFSVFDNKKDHVKFGDDFYYVEYVKTNKQGRVKKDDDGDLITKSLEFDVTSDGEILINYDEILDYAELEDGNYPEDFTLLLSGDIFSNKLKVNLKIPEDVIKRYITGKVTCRTE